MNISQKKSLQSWNKWLASGAVMTVACRVTKDKHSEVQARVLSILEAVKKL